MSFSIINFATVNRNKQLKIFKHNILSYVQYKKTKRLYIISTNYTNRKFVYLSVM